MRKIFLGLTVLLVGVLSACTGTSDDTFKITTTLFPHYDIAAHLVTDDMEVELILPAGVSPHDYEPSPQTMVSILESDLFIYTSHELEPWIDAIIEEASNHDVIILEMAEFVSMIESDHDHDDHDHEEDHEDHDHEEDHDDHDHEEDHDDHDHDDHDHEEDHEDHDHEEDHEDHDHEEDHEDHDHEEDHDDHDHDDHDHEEDHDDHDHDDHDHDDHDHEEDHDDHDHEEDHDDHEHDDHDHGSEDPHFWTDPLNMIKMVSAIRDQLIELAEESEAVINENAQNYIDDLQAYHIEMVETVEASATRVMMHGGHNAFGYLAARYDLEFINPYEGFSTDAEPTPLALQNMIDLMSEYGTRYLFSEQLLQSNVADVIADETGAEILYLYSMGQISNDTIEDGMTVLDMMNHNLEMFKLGLSS